jgi:hypothetical protein
VGKIAHVANAGAYCNAASLPDAVTGYASASSKPIALKNEARL